jgi:hypothetical protein
VALNGQNPCLFEAADETVTLLNLQMTEGTKSLSNQVYDNTSPIRISGSHGGEHEDSYLLDCSAV